MYEQTKTMAGFYIAGFKYWDGAQMLSSLKVGQKLKMVAEPDNPADLNAIALYRKGVKLGYVPHDKNEFMAKMMFYGHNDAFEAVILSVDKKAAPHAQVYVAVKVKDARKKK